MLKSLKPIILYSLAWACLVLQFSGCETTENDVTAARENVSKEQRETEQAKMDADRLIREKEKALEDARHSAMRVPFDKEKQEVLKKSEEELAETSKEAGDIVRKEERETQEAKEKAERLEGELSAKKARDAYVVEVEAQIKTVGKRIESMNERLQEMAESVEHQQLETDVEVLTVKRDKLNEALGTLKNAEVLEWETAIPQVEEARKRLADDNDDSDGQ